MNYEDSLVLNETLLSVIDNCNNQIMAINQIENFRASMTKADEKRP